VTSRATLAAMRIRRRSDGPEGARPRLGAIASVIIVEDDPGMGKALERMLAASGYRAATFPNAESLLAANAAGGADCLVLDVQLPGLSGFELRRRLAHDAAATPVIFISGHDTPAARGEAERLGASAFLAKPFSGRALARAVGRALGRS
jgi:FixJ family two-component response regulator